MASPTSGYHCQPTEVPAFSPRQPSFSFPTLTPSASRGTTQSFRSLARNRRAGTNARPQVFLAECLRCGIWQIRGEETRYGYAGNP